MIARAHAVVEETCDADSSWEEVFAVLLENGFPEDVARAVADDVRDEVAS